MKTDEKIQPCPLCEATEMEFKEEFVKCSSCGFIMYLPESCKGDIGKQIAVWNTRQQLIVK